MIQRYSDIQRRRGWEPPTVLDDITAIIALIALVAVAILVVIAG